MTGRSIALFIAAALAGIGAADATITARGSSSIGRVPVSKTGGSRFESWLPRFPRSAARR